MKVALIGVGNFGGNILKSLSNNDKIKEICLCDNDENRLDAAWRKGNLPNYNGKWNVLVKKISFEEILKTNDIYTVFIATPAGTHFKLASECLLNNKKVFLEKPMTLSYKDAQELVKLVGETDNYLHVDNTFVYSQEIQHLSSCIKFDRLGKIQHFSSVRANWTPNIAGIDVIFDLLPHDLSILDYIFPLVKFDKVFANGVVEDGIIKDITIRLYSNSFAADIHASWLYPFKTRQIIVRGTEAFFINDSAITNECKIQYINNKQPDILNCNLDNKSPLDIEINHFLNKTKEKKDTLSNYKHGLEIVRILEKIKESFDSKKEVLL